MPGSKFKIKAEVWIYPGPPAGGGWHFVTLPKNIGAQINKKFGKFKRGWGSLPVKVSIGNTNWETSIFPDKKSGSYLLPLKAETRKKEGIKRGDVISFLIEIGQILK